MRFSLMHYIDVVIFSIYTRYKWIHISFYLNNLQWLIEIQLNEKNIKNIDKIRDKYVLNAIQHWQHKVLYFYINMYNMAVDNIL